MNKFRITGLLVLVGLMAACGKMPKSAGKQEEVVVTPFNPLVEGFTNGVTSRKSKIEITFTEALPSHSTQANEESSLPLQSGSVPVKITPKTKGEWIQVDKKLVFTPEEELKRGEQYRVDVDLKKLFPGNPEAKDFTFAFRTIAPAASAELATILYESDGTYTVKGVLYTSDFEDSTRIAKITEWKNEGKEVTWEQGPDGRSHIFTAPGVAPGSTDKVLTLSVNDSKSGYKKETLLTVHIPDKNKFQVLSADYISTGAKCVEVRFSKPVSEEQDLTGLIVLDGVESMMRVEGNRVLLYPEQTDKAETELFVDSSVQSREGQTIGEPAVLTVPMGSDLPQVRFVGKGTMIPPSSAMGSAGGQGVPFQAINLKAVRVDVFRISEKAMGQFIQQNEISENYNLMSTARPVATKTIFLDAPEQGERSLGKWSTYSLNLDELLEVEQGALYSIQLSFDRSMSGLSCIGDSEKITPQAAAEADANRIEALKKRFDRGGYYWDYGDWSDYNWREREDPCTPSYYYDKEVKRNLLATDLGVIAKGSDRPEMLFIVNSLTTTKPVNGATVELMNYQGMKLADGTTNSLGEALIDFEGKGRPYYAVVSKGAERNYMKVNAGRELSTSTFDVSGERMQEGLRGFIWADRGVWRPGDTIFMNFTTAGFQIPKDHPVTVELRSPLGQLYQKKTVTYNVDGIYSFILQTEPESPTGVWNASVTVGGATFTKRLRIETVKPNRLKIDLKFPDKIVQARKPWGAFLHGEWLTGAKAGNLKYVVETSFSEAGSAWAGDTYRGYVFDNAYKQLSDEGTPEYSGTTDEDGNAELNSVTSGGTQAGGMLRMHLMTRLFEPSGEASIDAQDILYSPFTSYVGIHPPAGADKKMDTEKTHEFQLATITPQGQAAKNRKIEVKAYRVVWYWWWDADSRSDIAHYVSNRSLYPAFEQEVKTDAQGKGSFSLSMTDSEWGTYYVTARDEESGHESAVLIYVDWPSYGNRMSEMGGAMQLDVSLDKENYKPGDKATVRFPASKGSRAIISVEDGTRVLETMAVEIDKEGGMGQHTFTVTGDMQPNVYLNVTLLQPYGSVENDLPVRLYGIVPLYVSSPESRLEPEIKTAEEVLPESEMTITVSEKRGRKMAYSLVVVDEGLLDLTRFRTPNPWDAFHAKVALGISTWDVYNNVLGAYGGKIEQMFAVGGDGELDGALKKPSVNRFPPVVRYLGTFTLKKGEKKTHKVTLPAYMGRVRVMAVAVSQDADDGNGAWGSAEQSVVVKAPLVMLGTAPRAVAAEDEIVVPATLIATEDRIGKVKVSVETNDLFTVVGKNTQEVTLNQQGDRIVYFRLKVRGNADARKDAGYIKLIAQREGAKPMNYAMDIPVRNLSTPVMQGNSYTVKANGKWEGTVPLKGIEGTRRMMLEVSTIQPLNATQRMEFLSTYPYGCIEQITSGAFPHLYLPDLTDLNSAELAKTQGKVRSVLNRYKQYALPDGSMGYWPGSTSPSGWGSVYALHFMTAAKLKGYEMPAGVYDRLMSSVRGSAVRWNSADRRDMNLQQAYQLYVLALAGNPEWGAMNRLRQSRYLSRDAAWMLAAAYGVGGRKDVGKTIVADIAKTTSADASRSERFYMYGSEIRSQSIELMSASVLGMSGEAAQMANRVSGGLSKEEWLSTQSTAWAMMSLGEYVVRSGLADGFAFDWSVDGEQGSVKPAGSKKSAMWMNTWNDPKSGQISITNKTEGTLYIRTVGSWMSAGNAVPSASNGLTVNVHYLDDNGSFISVDSLKRGTDFIAQVVIWNDSGEAQRDLMLTHPVASGWEILPMVVMSGENAGEARNLPQGVTYQDVRDDRVDSYIPVLENGRTATIQIRLNASYAGTYTLPAIRCAAMYNDSVSGNTESTTVTVQD